MFILCGFANLNVGHVKVKLGVQLSLTCDVIAVFLDLRFAWLYQLRCKSPGMCQCVDGEYLMLGNPCSPSDCQELMTH